MQCDLKVACTKLVRLMAAEWLGEVHMLLDDAIDKLLTSPS